MKITKAKLKQIIKEELETVIGEGIFDWFKSKPESSDPAEEQEPIRTREEFLKKHQELEEKFEKFRTLPAPGETMRTVNYAMRVWQEEPGETDEYYLQKGIDRYREYEKMMQKEKDDETWRRGERQKEEDKAYYDEKLAYHYKHRPERSELKPGTWGLRGSDSYRDPDYGMSPEDLAQRDLDKRRSR